jgi:thiamine-monophosphate kinase
MMDSLSEFDIIKRYFSFANTPHQLSNAHTLVGIGDDAAVIDTDNKPLVVATDTLIEGVHFPPEFLAEHVATRAMGVNLSDFAAMGATPRWMTMALSLSQADPKWLAVFSKRLSELCEQYNVALIGGDTTKINQGLVVSLTVIGETQSDSGLCLRRSGAQVGDDVWVSGSLGKGAAALQLLIPTEDLSQWVCSADDRAELLSSFYAPIPRLALGKALIGVASAAIDISDGLVADAHHIASQSNVQIKLDGEALPVHSGLASNKNNQQVQQWVLGGGDEYELLLTASPNQSGEIQALSSTFSLPCTKIGTVVEGAGVNVLGEGWDINNKGYTHF